MTRFGWVTSLTSLTRSTRRSYGTAVAAWFVAAGLVISLAGSSVASAQATTQPGGGSLTIGMSTGVSTGQPRQNVRGGAVGARRPGLRLQAAVARGNAFQSNSLGAFGGASPVPESSLPPPLQRTILLDVLQQVFGMVDQLQVLLQALRPAAPVPI